MSSSYLLINGLRYHYNYWNLDGAGRPVVLLHSLGSNSRIWEKAAPLLAEQGMTLMAPDQRGHGQTDGPDGDYGFDSYFADLAAFMDQLNLERPLLVGYSWGAMVALDYAARRSFGLRSPAGIVLVDGGLTQLDDEPGITWEKVRDRLVPTRLDGLPMEEFLSRLGQGKSGWKPDEQSLSILLANFEIDGDEKIYPHLSYDHHMQIVRAMWDYPTYKRISQISCPILAIPSRSNGWLSDGEKRLLKQKEKSLTQIHQINPGLRTHWMEGSIQDIPLQKPGELARVIIDFARQISFLP